MTHSFHRIAAMPIILSMTATSVVVKGTMFLSPHRSSPSYTSWYLIDRHRKPHDLPMHSRAGRQVAGNAP